MCYNIYGAMFHTSNSIPNRMWWCLGWIAMNRDKNELVWRRYRLNLKFNFASLFFGILFIPPTFARAAKPIYCMSVDFMQHNGSFSLTPKSHVVMSSRKKGWNYTFSHRFINKGDFPFHASSTGGVVLLWNVSVCH